jgi:hypothetical protein
LEYKADTNSVAQWLASTAIRYGYPKDLLIGTKPLQVQQPSKRLKGKARKLAREATAETAQNGARQTANEQQKIPRYINLMILSQSPPWQNILPADATQKLTNKFEGLEVQEPSEAFLQAPDAVVSKDEAEKPDAIYATEQVHDIEEAFFLFTLLMQDYNEL